MEWGNLILFWALLAFVLFVLNFLLFRFGIIRKIVYIVSAGFLIGDGFTLGNLLVKYAHNNANSSLYWNNDSIDTMLMFSILLFILVLLMSFGDSILDWEEETEYHASVSEFMGSYFVNVSEHSVSVPSFFIYYAISTGIALAVHFIFIYGLRWFYIYGVLGCIALAYLLIIKPLILKNKSRFKFCN